jgi:tetratricopeptide (TPR) repeat protein
MPKHPNSGTAYSFTFPLIVAATFLAYLPALNGGLLWDDTAHITRPELRSFAGLWRIWTVPGATQQYYPLLHSAFWLEHSIWGDTVLWYHLLNVALHALSACLVVLIVRRLALPGAWLAGLLFALHPLCVEAVAWISEQKSTLSAVFYLAAALAYLKFDESRKRTAYLAALGFFIAALLAKTVTAVLPGVLLVILWWRRGRIEWKRDIKPLIPWFGLGASAGLFTAWAERTLVGAQGAEFALTPLDRVLLAGRVIWFYAAKTLWPINLAFFYPRWHIDPSAWWQYLFPVGVVLVGYALAGPARRSRAPLAAFLIFIGTLFPVLGFFNVYPFRYSFVADHFAYLAILAILIPVAALLGSRPIPSALLAALLGILTFQQAGTYRDEETLYRATIEHNPDAWLAHNNLANLLLATPSREAEAMEHIQTALRLNPDFAEAHITMGNALLQSPGRLADAIAEYQTAVRLAPASERAHTNLGNSLLQSGRTDEAIAELHQALHIDPNNAEAHNDLGNAMLRLPGRLPDAIAQYRLALAANPDFAEAHNNLGRALAADGRLPDAIAEFQAAIRIRPDYATAHSNLGNALSMLPGRLNDAVAEYREALRIRPDFPDAHYNLGIALRRMPGREQEAAAEIETALRLRNHQ